MIRNYNLGTAFASLAKPTGIGKGYFHNNDAGFTLDYLYGPYDVPENEGILQFTYEDADENTVIRPTQLIDGDPGPEGTWNYNQSNIPVYNTRLDYQKALAEQMLRDMDQFFVGKKVAFITVDGKAKEYVVVPIPNTDPVELEFEDADFVDIYTINFDTINGTGAQSPVETVTKLYTLPQSQFIPPKQSFGNNDNIQIDQFFEGWYFSSDGTSDTIDYSTKYQVGETVNIEQLCESAHITSRRVTFFAKYMVLDGVAVDFQNGYYKSNGEFVDLDGGGNMSGYLQIQYAVNSQTNTKPEDWDTEYMAYFTRTQISYGKYVEVDPLHVLINIGEDEMNNSAREWTQEHATSWFGNEIQYRKNPTYAGLLLYNSDPQAYPFYSYVYTVTDNTYQRWFKYQASSIMTWQYTRCTQSYATYQDKDLFTHIIRDTMAVFNNGTLFGNIQHDCMDGTVLTAFQGLQVQLNTSISDTHYSSRFEFDRWEIEPKKYGDNGEWVDDITMASWTEPYVNPTILLNSEYQKTVDGGTVNCPADAYLFRAVYRKRDEYYAKLQLDTNCAASGTPSGEIQITCKYKKPRSQNSFGTCTVGTYNVSGYHLDQALTNSQSIQLGDNCFEFDPNIITSVTLTAIPNNTDPETTPYCWTFGSNERTYGNKVENISLSSGITLNYKAWFIFDGDTRATVSVVKRLSSPSTSMLFNGSDVGVYDWQIRDNQTNAITSAHMVSSIAYLYDHLDTKPEPITQMAVVVGTDTDSGPHDWENDPNIIHRYQKIINWNAPLGNPAHIEIGTNTHHGYCYIAATEGQNDGAKFLRWADGNTNPIRLIDVTLPTTYKFTAIFKGGLDLASLGDYAELGKYDYEALVAQPINKHIKISEISHELADNTLFIQVSPSEQIYAHIPLISYMDNPESVTEYNNLVNTAEKTVAKIPSQDSTVTYDYKGTQYKETVVEVGKDIVLEN